MKTRLPRSSFHHAVVTFFGRRRSTSRANASAARRTTGNSQLRLDAAEDVDAAVPRGLRPADVADLVEHLAHERRDALPVLERRARLRVDVDPQLVRMLRVLPARRPRVEVDDREVRRPDDLGELGHAELVGVAARTGTSRAPSRPTPAASRAPASGRSARRRSRRGSGGAASAARTACARCRPRPRCSTRRGRASSSSPSERAPCRGS